MTTGHAPDDWLDIPAPPFAPGEGGDDRDAEGDGDGDGEMPTGELQVIDVPDADEAADADVDEAAANGAEVPTGKIPVVDADGETAADAGAGDQATPAPAITMTGQFRAVAAALAADVTATRSAELAAGDRETGERADAAEAEAGTQNDEVSEGSAASGAGGDADGGEQVAANAASGVAESAPEAKAWRVPVLRSKRDPDQPVPPDAVPAPAASAVPVPDEETDAPAAEAGTDLGPRAKRRIQAHRHRTVKLRRQRRLAVGGLALLLTAGATLGMVGMSKVRGSTGGEYIDPQIRPDEPGYVALVTPTPTLLVVHKDAAGGLSGVSLLSLHAQDQGGSVIVIPVSTVAPFADAGTSFADAYAEDGAEAVATQVELILNVAVGETVEVDDVRWSTLVDPVAPITIDLDKAVGEWPAGPAQIPADQVGTFLTARTDGETELGRLDRQELFWETWIPLVKAGGRNAVPGEVDVGLGRFVRGLAAGDIEVTSLPVSAAFSNEEMYGPSEEMLPDLVAHAVPYPQEPSRGSRIQIQLLNGTTQRDLTARAATPLVAGGAEIALVGNAASFAEPTTRFVYATTKTRDDAEKLRDAFGVGEVVQAPSADDAPPVDEDRIDVTVILGADALDALGG